MRFILLGLTVGWLVVGLMGMGLLIGLGQSDGLVRYPRSARLKASELRLDALPNGRIELSTVYHTPDTWTEALAWYARHLKPDLDRRPRLAGDCYQFTDTDSWLVIRQSIVVTLCARTNGATIFVQRRLVWPVP
jgi:hypothetical protein